MGTVLSDYTSIMAVIFLTICLLFSAWQRWLNALRDIGITMNVIARRSLKTANALASDVILPPNVQNIGRFALGEPAVSVWRMRIVHLTPIPQAVYVCFSITAVYLATASH